MYSLGNRGLLSTDETWRALLDQYRQDGCIVQATSFLVRDRSQVVGGGN